MKATCPDECPVLSLKRNEERKKEKKFYSSQCLTTVAVAALLGDVKIGSKIIVHIAPALGALILCQLSIVIL